MLAWALLALAPARVVTLPAGTTVLSKPMEFTGSVEVRGAPAGSTLAAGPRFRGAALIVCRGCRQARFHDFALEGNREALEARTGLPPSDVPFARFTMNSGLLAEDADGLAIDNLLIGRVAGMAVLVTRSRGVSIARVRVEQSGSRDPRGHNNATGGILLEEGSGPFRVADCRLSDIRGNGIWTHSLYTSPRNHDGAIERNQLDRIGRDAIQVGHAERVTARGNRGSEIGYPAAVVNLEEGAIPVALDTAGNVSECAYRDNTFQDVNGKCIDLDGFHDGAVEGNRCVNRRPREAYPNGNYGIVMNNSNPDMRPDRVVIRGNTIDGALYGGLFLIGTQNTVEGNRLLRLNLAHCNDEAARFGCLYAAGEPDLLRSGIYLGRGGAHPAPARANLIRDNRITGFGMAVHCIAAAPGVAAAANTIERNRCSGTP